MVYKVKGLPWSCGIGKNVSDCLTTQEVMKKSGLDYEVQKCKLVAKMPFSIKGNNEIKNDDGFAYKGNIYRDCYNAFATYRTDYNIPLGIVKDKYEVIQNVDAFSFFDDAIGKDKAVWDTAGCFGHGNKIFVSAKLPQETIVGNDKIDNYLVFGSSHDGSSSINILFTPIRVICTNMLNGALNNNNAYIRIKHTVKAKEKLQIGAEILRVACEYAKSTQELYKTINNCSLNEADVIKYIADLHLTEEERNKLLAFDKDKGYEKLLISDYRLKEQTNISQRKINTIISIYNYYHKGIGQDSIKGTAWGAYNAVTGYYSNVVNMEGEKRVESLLYGGANKTMNKALNNAYNLAIAI